LTKDETDALIGYYLHAFDALQALELLLTKFDKTRHASYKIVRTIILIKTAFLPLSGSSLGTESIFILTPAANRCIHRTSMGKKKRERQELLPGTLDMLILKALTRDVMHGYGIAEHIRQLSDEVLQVEEGSLYPALQRLQLQGLIASEWGHSINNRKARYYRLTRAGRRQLGETESSFARLVDAITRVMKPA
jgi:PadR family transcriptional regulator PadR